MIHDDPYIDPDTGVLYNKLGKTNADELRESEELVAAIRIDALRESPIVGDFDYAHMKAIHRHIFQDVYDWAGQQRTWPIGEPMSKKGANVVDPFGERVAYAYYAADRLDGNVEPQYHLLRVNLINAHEAGQLDREAFLTEYAERWAEINVLHVFREGNTRSQFAFFTQLANHCGYRLDAAHFVPGQPARDQFVNARFFAQATGDSRRLRQALDPAFTQAGTNPRQRWPNSSATRPPGCAPPAQAREYHPPRVPPTSRPGADTRPEPGPDEPTQRGPRASTGSSQSAVFLWSESAGF